MASAALSRRPKYSTSDASVGPRMRGSSAELQNSGHTPICANGAKKLACGTQYTASQCGSTVRPTPTARPFTAAMSGFGTAARRQFAGH